MDNYPLMQMQRETEQEEERRPSAGLGHHRWSDGILET
jgi:hypothetical protein